jgi:hypothetical protein
VEAVEGGESKVSATPKDIKLAWAGFSIFTLVLVILMVFYLVATLTWSPENMGGIILFGVGAFSIMESLVCLSCWLLHKEAKKEQEEAVKKRERRTRVINFEKKVRQYRQSPRPRMKERR